MGGCHHRDGAGHGEHGAVAVEDGEAAAAVAVEGSAAAGEAGGREAEHQGNLPRQPQRQRYRW